MYSNVSLSNYAAFYKRFAAFIIDEFILCAGIGLLYFVIGYYFYLPLIFLGWLYFSIMECSQYQATLGKMAIGITVADLFEKRISFGRATGRFFGKYISSIFCIGFIMAAFTERRQGLHDILAGTLVLDAAASRINQGSNSEKVYVSAQSSSENSFGKAPILYGITGEYAGRSLPIGQRGVTLGRDSGICQLTFSKNTPGISRRHCVVNFNQGPDTFTIVDVGSSYGTFLESGIRVMQGQPVTIRSGERFYVSDRKNMFEVRL